MADAVRLEVVSPDRLVMSRSVEMAVLPGAEGDIAAMPGTAPLIISLRGGVIRIFEGGQITERLFVAGGFAEIVPENCTILADNAVKVSDLSKAAADQALIDAQTHYDTISKQNIAAVDQALEQLQISRARLEAIAGAL